MKDLRPIRTTEIFNQPFPTGFAFKPGRLVILEGLLLGLNLRECLVLVVFTAFPVVVAPFFVEPSAWPQE